jgi:hypothetical protein
MKSAGDLSGVSGKVVTETLEEYRFKFNALYPALAEEMDYLLTISNAPQGSFAVFKKRVMAFAQWLNVTFHNGQG